MDIVPTTKRIQMIKRVSLNFWFLRVVSPMEARRFAYPFATEDVLFWKMDLSLEFFGYTVWRSLPLWGKQVGDRRNNVVQGTD